MKKILSVLLLLVVGASYTWAAEEDRAKVLDRAQSASNVLDEIMSTPDKGIPQEILQSARCAIVVPSMLKGGFIVGARYGKGFATCRTSATGNRWSAPAPIRVEGGSWGLQIGGQAVDLVMLVMNNKGLQHLLSSKFAIGADASAAAGPVGRHAEAGTDWKMRAELLTYSRSRGAFAGITLNGASIRQDTDDTLALYGKDVSFNSLLSGKVPPPAGTQHFLATIRKDFGEAKVAGNERREAKAQEKEDKAAAENTSTASTSNSGGMSSAASAGPGTQNMQSGQTGSVAGKSSSDTTQSTTSTTTETTNPNSNMSQSNNMSGSNLPSDQVQSNIQKALRNTPNLSANNVSVNVTDDQVVLSGSVPTDADRATIRRLAQQNAGNRKVVDDSLAVK